MLRNIKSKIILKKIFENVKNKKKIKVIKHNKKLINQLNITKQDFLIYEKIPGHTNCCMSRYFLC